MWMLTSLIITVICNLCCRNRWRSTFLDKDMTAEDAVFNQLENMLEEDARSNAVININEETKEIQSIFFQTSFMKEAFQKYPELLSVDTTHNLCTNNMPLTVYEVVDCFGAGRIAGYSLLSNETADVVTASLGVLVQGCPESAEKLQVVLIDRQRSKWNSHPSAKCRDTSICDRHVKEIFDKEGKAKMGKSERNFGKDEIFPLSEGLWHGLC